MAIDMYQTGVSGLMAAQGQLATTGHNIANVNTEGFNRQRAEQMTDGGLNSGGQFYGTGTRISDVTRMYQQYAFKDVLINSTEQAGATTMYQQLNYLNSSVNDNGKALSSSLDSLYKTIDAFTDNPADLGNRQLLLAHAQEVASSFNTMHRNLDQQYSTSSADIASRANKVSELAAGIAQLNQEILNVGSSGSPNDLLDRRDQLISDLGQEVSITTINEPGGAVSIMLGGRDTLVSGSRAFSLEARPGNPDPQQTELYLTAPDQAKQATKLNASDLGGKLGATAKFRDTVLAPTLSDIGRTAIGLADAFNQVQRQGLDLNGVPGADLFTDVNTDQARIGRFFTDNTSVSGEVSITDTSKLTGSEYRLDYKDGDYFITDLNGGKPQAIIPDADGKLNVNGFSVSISGTPANGDHMLLRPTRNGATDIGISLKKPEGLAAASQFTTTAHGQNSGNASLSSQITNNAGADLPTKNDPLVVSLNAAGEYQVAKKSDPTTIIQAGILDPQDPVITLDGLTINVVGQAGTADNFEIATASGAGNNVNAQAFGDIKQQKLFNDGKSTIGDSINQTLVGIGGKTHSQKIKADSTTAALAQSQNRMQSVSGVNLDEEAANLLRFQQAYMASSRVISVANELFNSLLQIR